MVRQKNSPSTNQQVKKTLIQELILFNDDVNTFEFVIDTLIDVCEHEPEQAEQCAMVAHFKGKCMVKSGDFTELKPLCEEMTRRGLIVSIE